LSDSVRYRATVAYVGTFFHGWQRQSNADRTVQAVVEKGIHRLAGGSVVVHASGRTDTGVHADGQVIHFDLHRRWLPQDLRDGVNSFLPWDVRLLDVREAADEFHARRDALWKEYLYRWSRSEVVPPKDSLFVAPIVPRAEPSLMALAVRTLPGDRDFSVFGVRLPRGDSGRRNLHAVAIVESGAEIRALFRGDGFLRGMVRSLCGVLADVARGKVPPERMEELLATGDRKFLSPKAPACGLTLARVAYRGDLP
jgi:tRNA pseudouridine38-40 synthase